MLERRHLLPTLALPLALAGCDPAPTPPPASTSPNARVEIVEAMRRDLAAPRHPSDGGGRGWIESGPQSAAAGSHQRWRLVYEAGPLGIRDGGMLFLQVSPFWGWSSPQTTSPDFAGFTEVSTDAAGLTLEPRTLGQQLLAVHIRGRDLEEGERVIFDYGAGPAGARVDTYAESRSRLWFAVDGDGDGIRQLVADSPTVEVVAGPPARLLVIGPSTAAPGESVRLTVAVLDRAGNAGTRFIGEIALSADEGLELESPIRFTAEDRGHRTVEARAVDAGVFRVDAAGPDGLTTTSNPLRIEAAATPVLWADLHGHSGLSDGTGTPRDYLTYAREIAALDVVSLTDHDHWGLQPLSRSEALWGEIRDETRRAHEPGRFVALLGYEWTSWIHGHRHVLHFGDEADIASSVDPATETPAQLWDSLRGLPALTLAHHSAGAPIATNWDYAPDPVLEPVTEITSVHGSSEAADSPRVVAGAINGNFVRDALDRGFRLGFLGSGDSHDGHPGLVHLVGANGGLAALVGAERSRASVLETLRARRVYATNGPRILLEVTLDGEPMGSTLRARVGAELVLRANGTDTIERVDLVRSGSVFESVPGGNREVAFSLRIDDPSPGEYLYARVVQIDGGAAWSSPFFFE